MRSMSSARMVRRLMRTLHETGSRSAVGDAAGVGVSVASEVVGVASSGAAAVGGAGFGLAAAGISDPAQLTVSTARSKLTVRLTRAISKEYVKGYSWSLPG
jgi:hypothetical protein